MVAKSKPQRMCVGCKTMKDKTELLRVVKTPEGEIVIDPSGKRSGRGAYICRQTDCLEQALKHKGLERAFKCPINDDVKAELREHMAELAADGR